MPLAIFILMLGGISLNTLEPEVFLQGVLEEVPELVVSVSIVASLVTFQNIGPPYLLVGLLISSFSFFACNLEF